MRDVREGFVRQRLTTLGLRPVAGLRVTQNRSVLVSLSRNRVLSIHQMYADAPDVVLRAIVRFVAPGSSPEVRRTAQREILSYYRAAAPVVRADSPSDCVRRPDRPLPGDAEAVERLGLLFDGYNRRHFRASLPNVPIRLSGRMRSRLGHLTLGADGRPAEITISRRHLSAHGWDEAAHTLLHEMVHLWQCVNGLVVDHGPGFREMARRIGVTASARRWVRSPKLKKVAATQHLDPGI